MFDPVVEADRLLAEEELLPIKSEQDEHVFPHRVGTEHGDFQLAKMAKTYKVIEKINNSIGDVAIQVMDEIHNLGSALSEDDKKRLSGLHDDLYSMGVTLWSIQSDLGDL